MPDRDESFYPRDDNLREYATDRQWQILEEYWRAGSALVAGPRLGLSHQRVSFVVRRVRTVAARRGYCPDADMSRAPVPDGYRVRGVSSLYKEGEDKPVLQWIKTTIDSERQAELLAELVAGLTDDIPRAEPVPAPDAALGDLCVIYPVGDHHLGMYAWDEETGENYDMSIAERLLVSAFNALTDSAPAATTALVVLIGDQFHYDSLEPLTPANKNLLDSDGRYAKMVRVGVRMIRAGIDAVLRKHARVTVIVQAGNHDPSSALFLAVSLDALYENDPRISVDTSPCPFHYFRHGQTLVGVCHGHEIKKLDQLPLIMATDRPADWGETRHRYWLTGHVHHDRVVDVQGVRVESLRVLPPADAWAHSKGYRSARDMKAIVIHRGHGEVARFVVRPEMLA